MVTSLSWRSTACVFFFMIAFKPALAVEPHRLELPVYMKDIKTNSNTDGQLFGVNFDLGNNKKLRLILDAHLSGLILFRNAPPGVVPNESSFRVIYRGILVEGFKTRARVNFPDQTHSSAIEIAVATNVKACCSSSILEEFDGILGLGSSGTLENPVLRFARRWIVDLPKHSNKSGRLILNPIGSEVERYSVLKPAYGGFLVHGCLRAFSQSLEQCAPTSLDFGSQGIVAYPGGSDPLEDVKRSGYFSISLDALNGAPVSWEVNYVGIASPHDNQADSDEWSGRQVILDWTLFSDFTLLYDYDRGTVGMRRRL